MPPDHYAYEAIEWAAEVGVTAGYIDGTFKPEQPLSKRHAVLFMESYYDQILQASESEDFTRGDMMVLLKAINDGSLRDADIGSAGNGGDPTTPTPAPHRLVTLGELWDTIGFSRRTESNWALDTLSLLDSRFVYLQERKIALPLAGETTLVDVRETSGTSRTMDVVEESVRQNESFMNVAFPYETLPVFTSESDSEAPGFFIDEPGFIVLSPQVEEESWFSLLITHEVAHAYWHPPFVPWRETPQLNGVGLVPFNWIFEGAARYMECLTVEAEWRCGDVPVQPSDTGCSLVETIGELDRRVFDPDESFIEGLFRSACDYSMGLGLFAALNHRLGEEEFRRGFRSLHLKISNLEHEDQCTGRETGICYVQKAFVDEASSGFAEAAGEVIDQWYHGR